jgi:hypothetical protein
VLPLCVIEEESELSASEDYPLERIVSRPTIMQLNISSTRSVKGHGREIFFNFFFWQRLFFWGMFDFVAF